MSEHPPVIEAEDAFLDRLAALDLQATQHVHMCLLNTEEPDEVAELAKAYARVSRCLRQTLGLHGHLKAQRARLAREAAREARDAARGDVVARAEASLEAEMERTRLHAVDERSGHLHDAVGRVISRAAKGDRDRHTRLAWRFDRELDDWHDKPDYLDLDLDAHVREACRRIGLNDDLARTWRILPAPTFFPDEDDFDALEDEDNDEPMVTPPRAQPGRASHAAHDADDDLDFNAGATPRKRSG